MLPVREVENLAIKSKVIYFLMKKYSNKCLMMDHHYQFKTSRSDCQIFSHV